MAQLDSAALRAKFGAPLHPETLAENQVCKLEVPAEMPSKVHEALAAFVFGMDETRLKSRVPA
jgi:hypothetical protein